MSPNTTYEVGPLKLIILVVILLLNGYSAITVHSAIRKSTLAVEKQLLDIPHELPMPSVPDGVLRFSNDYYNITDDFLWASMFPPAGSVVHLSGQEFDVAIYQQLRCLDAVRLAYLGLHHHRPLSPAVSLSEVERCIDILRQSILCTADTSLDPAIVVATPDGTRSSASTGVGVDHRCRDWTRVRDAVEANQRGTR